MIDQQLRRPARRAEIPQRAIHADAVAELAASTARQSHRDAVLLSLRKMLNGGIYDHVGGGLCRYSTDAEWLVPHFEKMLYDNAQLIRLANWAYAETGNELFRDRIEDTIAWLLREMRVDGGGFAASLDADSDGEEGLFYTWDHAEVESVLGDDADLLLRLLHAFAPRMAGKASRSSTRQRHQRAKAIADATRSPRCSKAARGAAKQRVRPGRDDKVLADWNGLMIAALAEAGRAA